MPNGVTMDREGNIVYCDLAKQAVMRVSQDGQVSLIADQVGDVKLTMPNFASYDAEGNLYVSNSSSAPTLEKALDELAQPAPNGALVRIRPDGQGDVVATGIYLANGYRHCAERRRGLRAGKHSGRLSAHSHQERRDFWPTRNILQRFPPPCPTGWPLTLTAISTSRYRPRSAAHMHSRVLPIRVSTWPRPIRSSRSIPMVSGAC